MRYYTLLAVLFSAVLFIGGCKKKDDPSLRDIMLGSKWKLTAATIDPPLTIAGSPVSNIYTQEAIIPSCRRDDITIFTSDGKYTIEEGATRCSPTDPTINESGDWTISSDAKSVRLVPTGQAATNYTVISASSGELKLSAPASVTGSTVSYTISYTFSKAN